MDQQAQTANAPRQNRQPRDMESRVSTMRPQAWRAPEVLPSPDSRPDWVHRWVRLSTLGTADPSNISSRLREGYEPCKAEEYPEMMMYASTDGRFKGGIEMGGLLLCRIPAEFLKQRMQHYERQNKAQVDSVDNSFLRENDPRMPLFSEKKSKVTFGSGS
ncbi:hypothetical protein EBT31_02105 [bacterium]|jgi:hypothetical protein|nr:hypothetical protein [bacterium]